MHDQLATVVTKFFSGDALKGAVISGVISISVWAGHTFISKHDESRDQSTVLAQHTQQISELQGLAKSTSTAVQGVVLSQARMEGTVNTINQKLDDDRRQMKINNLAQRGRN